MLRNWICPVLLLLVGGCAATDKGGDASIRFGDGSVELEAGTDGALGRPDAQTQADCSVCDPNAECTPIGNQVMCECRPGFNDDFGDGRSCSEFATTCGGCGTNAACIVDEAEVAACKCLTGYVGDPDTACSFDCNQCDANAMCDPEAGTCTCNVPFEGSGFSCLFDCTSCGSNSNCDDQMGTCSCKSGYDSPNGKNCTDINECASNNGGCGGGYTCVNTAGGRNCNDINECATNNGSCTWPNESCTNNNGGRSCSSPVANDLYYHHIAPTRLAKKAYSAGNNNVIIPGVPASSVAVMNVTVVGAKGNGYAIFTSNNGTATVSNLNYQTGTTVANLVLAKTNGSRVTGMYLLTAEEVIIDVLGYFNGTAGAGYEVVTSKRLLNKTNIAADSYHPVSGVPSGAYAAFVTVATAGQIDGGFFKVQQSSDRARTFSSLNANAGETRANGVIVRLNGATSFEVFAKSRTNRLIVDLHGIFKTTSGARLVMQNRSRQQLNGVGEKATPLITRVSGAKASWINLAGKTTGPAGYSILYRGTRPDPASHLNTINAWRSIGVIAPRDGNGDTRLYSFTNDSGAKTDYIVDTFAQFR